MLIYGASYIIPYTRWSLASPKRAQQIPVGCANCCGGSKKSPLACLISINTRYNPVTAVAVAVTVTAAVSALLLTPGMVLEANAVEVEIQQQEADATLSNVPQELSSECGSEPEDCKKKARIQRPKSRQAETCTVKCVNTCIRGGMGSPGEGPLNIRRPLVVFKEGFRSRHYCLVECSDICNLIKDGDDGP